MGATDLSQCPPLSERMAAMMLLHEQCTQLATRPDEPPMFGFKTGFSQRVNDMENAAWRLFWVHKLSPKALDSVRELIEILTNKEKYRCKSPLNGLKP